jgi:hypothetical protein
LAGAFLRSLIFRLAALVCVALFAMDARAAAQPTLDGTWSASPLTVKWVIGDWGPACGPQPSGGGEGAASIIIHETAGELVLTGGGRVYSTTQCWEQYPGIQRSGHAASSRSWKTTCKTPAGDARQATVSTTLTATDSAISFYEAGQYQFVIQSQNCTASVGRYRTYSLVQRAATPGPIPPSPSGSSTAPSASASAAKPATSPSPAQKAENRCKTPGPAARLEVRPARKLIKAGEDFEFRAIVSDAQGCAVFSKPTWAIETGAGQGEVSPTGVVKVKPDATEGEMRLTASVGGRSASVVVEIASLVRYDALLKSGAFNAAGEVDEAASVAIASQSIGSAKAVAQDLATDRKHIFVALVGVVAAALAVFGFLLFRRSRKAQAAAQPAAATSNVPSHSPAGPMINKPAGLGSTQMISPDFEQAGPNTAAAGPPREGFGGMTVIVPGPEQGPPVGGMTIAAAPPEATAARQRARTLCPMCGMEYGPESKFCGKDGATLVPLN